MEPMWGRDDLELPDAVPAVPLTKGVEVAGSITEDTQVRILCVIAYPENADDHRSKIHPEIHIMSQVQMNQRVRKYWNKFTTAV